MLNILSFHNKISISQLRHILSIYTLPATNLVSDQKNTCDYFFLHDMIGFDYCSWLQVSRIPGPSQAFPGLSRGLQSSQLSCFSSCLNYQTLINVSWPKIIDPFKRNPISYLEKCPPQAPSYWYLYYCYWLCRGCRRHFQRAGGKGRHQTGTGREVSSNQTNTDFLQGRRKN